jgi:ribose transport system permease protein
MSQTQLRTTRNGTSDRSQASKRQAWRNFIQVAGILPILVVICIVFSLVSPSFLSPGNLINVIRQASINIVLATGITFVILTGGIDLSVGSILGVTAVVGVLVSLIPGIGLLAIPAAPNERVIFLAVSC